MSSLNSTKASIFTGHIYEIRPIWRSASWPAIAVVCLLAAPSFAGAVPSEKVIWAFRGETYGDTPQYGTLIRDSAGNLYGTASGEWTSTPNNTKGLVYELTPPAQGATKWTYKPIYKFPGRGVDGSYPIGPLAMDPEGNLYGTTFSGIIYELSPPTDGSATWSEQTLLNAQANANSTLQGGVLRVKDGTLFGLVSTSNNGSIFGLAYSLTPPTSGQTSWTYTQIYSFLGGSDGIFPLGVLVQDAKGNLYGATESGGVDSDFGFGTVFELSPPSPGQSAWTESILYAFKGGATDGANPLAGLLLGTDGALYGTTSAGDKSNDGVVFKLSPPASGQGAWTEKIIHKFASNGSFNNGSSMSLGNLIAGPNGDLYGTTSNGTTSNGTTSTGGSQSYGTVFRLTPSASGASWGFKVLYNFPTFASGAVPEGALLYGAGKTLFGTTSFGGLQDCGDAYCGVIYEITQ